MSGPMNKILTLVKQAQVAAEPYAKTFMKYAVVELSPPTPAQIPEAIRSATKLIKDMKQGKWREMTVKDAWMNTLVGIEVACWFFVGECIGKFHIVGYKV